VGRTKYFGGQSGHIVYATQLLFHVGQAGRVGPLPEVPPLNRRRLSADSHTLGILGHLDH
jgi:hypothetical protein